MSPAENCFSTLFDADYHLMMIIGAVFVLVYTFIGGFLAESASDFMQAIVMIFALLTHCNYRYDPRRRPERGAG